MRHNAFIANLQMAIEGNLRLDHYYKFAEAFSSRPLSMYCANEPSCN